MHVLVAWASQVDEYIILSRSPELDKIQRRGSFLITDNLMLPIHTVGRHDITLTLTCAAHGMETGAVVVSEASANFQACRRRRPFFRRPRSRERAGRAAPRVSPSRARP